MKANHVPLAAGLILQRESSCDSREFERTSLRCYDSIGLGNGPLLPSELVESNGGQTGLVGVAFVSNDEVTCQSELLIPNSRCCMATLQRRLSVLNRFVDGAKSIICP